jgi:4'-phosphopantetheinyl transferase
VLDDAAIHLWLALEPPAGDARRAERDRALMSEDERRRELEIASEQDRGLYRVARVLARTALSRHAPVDPRDWAFERNRFGKPVVVFPEGLELDFSVSHTRGIALVLVAHRRSVGVDVERLDRTVAVEPALRLLAAAEVADLESRTGEAQSRRFLAYWTLKEAFAKARATGLSLPLDLCAFAIDPDDGVQATIDPALDPEPGRWWFALAAPAPGFVAGVAATRAAAGEEPRVEIHPHPPD